MYPPTPSAGHQAVGGNPSTQAWNPAMLLGGEVGKGGERGLGPMHTLADFRLIMLVHVASLWLSSQTQKGEPSFNYRCHSVCNWNDNIRNIATPPTRTYYCIRRSRLYAPESSDLQCVHGSPAGSATAIVVTALYSLYWLRYCWFWFSECCSAANHAVDADTHRLHNCFSASSRTLLKSTAKAPW